MKLYCQNILSPWSSILEAYLRDIISSSFFININMDERLSTWMKDLIKYLVVS